MEIQNPLLSVWMITYNQEKHIRKAIDGVLMQKTNFPIQLVIGEDCSHDNTVPIIKEYIEKYPRLLKVRFNKKNIGMMSNVIKTFEECNGKYIAMLEGDDYWTDPYKLQKQVDFLEANPEYGLVHTDFDHNFIINGLIKKNYWRDYIHRTKEAQEGCVFEKVLIFETSIATNTACFRREFIEQKVFHKLMKLDLMSGDFPLWCHIAYQSKIAYLPESTAVRNVLPKSATQGQSAETYLKFYKSAFKVAEFLIKYYKLPESLLHKPKLLFYTNTLSTYYGIRDKQAFSGFYNELKKEGISFNFDLKLMNFSFKLSFLSFFIRLFFFIKRKIQN